MLRELASRAGDSWDKGFWVHFSECKILEAAGWVFMEAEGMEPKKEKGGGGQTNRNVSQKVGGSDLRCLCLELAFLHTRHLYLSQFNPSTRRGKPYSSGHKSHGNISQTTDKAKIEP